MLILGIALTIVGFAGFTWVARQLQKSSLDRSPFIGPLWPVIAIVVMVAGLVIVFLYSVLTGVVIIGTIIAIRFISAVAGSKRTSRFVMRATYKTFKKSLVESGHPDAEIEALYKCLRSRQPFDSVGEEKVRSIVLKHPNIDELTEYVVQFDAWEASMKAEALRNAE